MSPITLAEALASVPDPRSRHGRRHPLVPVLCLLPFGGPPRPAHGQARPRPPRPHRPQLRDLLLALTRMHWRIENGPHCVRGVTMGEDASGVRRGGAAQVLGALRDLVIFVVA